MTKNEALKAAIDGKKVFHPMYPSMVMTWNGKNFVDANGCCVGLQKQPEVGWELVPEYVDFATAWKAYESGKVIVSEFWGSADSIAKKQKPETGFRWCFTPAEIRGKWLILGDE